MSHVAEGDLHAYLDGALSLYPEGEADRIREHLDQCAECARRLRDAEDLREKATTVLARTDPSAVDVPPFEEVRRMAKVNDRSSAFRASKWSSSLGWAASIVLALGTGWLLGRSPEAVLRPSVVLQPSANSGEEFLPEDDAISASVPATAERQDRVEIGRSAEPAAEAEEIVAERERDVDLADRAAVAENRAAAPVPLEVPVETLNVAGERAAAAMFEDVAADADVAASARSIEALLPANLLVPGLPVLGIRWAELAPGVEGLVVRQRLVQDTTTLELRFVGLNGNVPDVELPRLLGPVPEGVRQSVRALAGGVGWVSLRGRLDQERLDGLLELLR